MFFFFKLPTDYFLQVWILIEYNFLIFSVQELLAQLALPDLLEERELLGKLE